MLGFVVFGSRTCTCTTAAPAFAASSAEAAICSGVTGTAGFFGGVSKPPVSAQVMTTCRLMLFLAPLTRCHVWTPAAGQGFSFWSDGLAGQRKARGGQLAPP